MATLVGGIEAGGTKFVCVVGTPDGEIKDSVRFPTEAPEQTMANVFKFFDQYDVKVIAIGSFGPIDINEDSATYGYITSTPKPGWTNFDFVGAMEKQYPGVKILWTTDVNIAGYGEYKAGAAKGHKNVLYVTVGTGVGVGYVQNGKFFQGFSHPEGGHMLPRRYPGDDFKGVCPYHGSCIEGLTAGPAVEARAGKKGHLLAVDDKVWDYEAFYLAQACATYTVTFRPDIIVFGGGVMKQEQLFDKIRKQTAELLNGYLDTPNMEDYIVHVGLGDDAGIKGCLLWAGDNL